MSSHKPETDDRHFTRGSSASTADNAVEGKVKPEERDIHGQDSPHARLADQPLKPGEKHDQLAAKEQASGTRQEALLDEAVEESFPASDPPSAKRIT